MLEFIRIFISGVQILKRCFKRLEIFYFYQNQLKMNNSNQNVLSAAEKVRAFAMGLIGSGFLAYGTTYFSEQSSYRVPRILIPVYNALGNVGLAVGMIVLGAILIFWALSKFRKNGGKPAVFIIFLAVCIAVLAALLWSGNTKSSPQATKEYFEEKEQKEKKKLAEKERPTLSTTEATTYLDKLEAINANMKSAFDKKDKAAFSSYEKAHADLLRLEFGKAMHSLTGREKKDFIKYTAKIENEISDTREQAKTLK